MSTSSMQNYIYQKMKCNRVKLILVTIIGSAKLDFQNLVPLRSHPHIFTQSSDRSMGRKTLIYDRPTSRQTGYHRKSFTSNNKSTRHVLERMCEAGRRLQVGS